VAELAAAALAFAVAEASFVLLVHHAVAIVLLRTRFDAWAFAVYPALPLSVPRRYYTIVRLTVMPDNGLTLCLIA